MQAEIAALKELLQEARSTSGTPEACPPAPYVTPNSRAGVWAAVVAAQLAGLAVYLTAAALCGGEHVEFGLLA